MSAHVLDMVHIFPWSPIYFSAAEVRHKPLNGRGMEKSQTCRFLSLSYCLDFV